MRINPINNMQVPRANFGQLKIKETENWDARYLDDFVHNQEVLVFVKYFDECEIDIEAQGHGKAGIGLYGKGKNGEDKFFYGIYGSRENLRNFNARKAVTSIITAAKDKIAATPKIEESLNFVELFNKALKINAERMSSNNYTNETQFEKKLFSE